MECNERIRDLLPDYYLGQLPPEETEEVRRHLTEHAACRDALEEVARVLDLMPFAVHETEPPPGLKERVMTRALEGNGRPVATEESSQQAVPQATPRPSSRRVRGRSDRGWRGVSLLAAAAAILVALVGLTWAYVDLQQDNRRLQAEVQELQDGGQQQEGLLAVAAQGTGRAPEARGTAVVDPVDGRLALDVYNLPEPPTGHSYRAWLVGSEGEALSLGPMELNERGDGRMTGGVTEPLSRYESLQLTVEPEDAESMSGPVYLEASL